MTPAAADADPGPGPGPNADTEPGGDSGAVAGSGEDTAQLPSGIELCYETFGPDDAPAVLLVMGLSGQMVQWEDAFCAELAAQGRRVIRFDNRDIGRSTILRDAHVPTRWELIRRDRQAADYALDDMADDAAGLLDHLEIPQADVVGVSMGGMIAQLLAIRHPDRTRSLVSIMSTTGNRRVGFTDPRLYPKLLRRPARSREEYISGFISTYNTIGSSRYPPGADRLTALAERQWERGYHPAGSTRQLGAIIAAPDRTPALTTLKLPAAVIHGDADRLVTPSGGRATAKAIPGARLHLIEGGAHDLPPALWPEVLEVIAATAAG